MALIISDSTLQQIHLTGEELLIDIACYLYANKKLGMGKARQLSGLPHSDFQRALGDRGIDLHYNEEDLQADLEDLGIRL